MTSSNVYFFLYDKGITIRQMEDWLKIVIGFLCFIVAGIGVRIVIYLIYSFLYSIGFLADSYPNN